MKKLLLIAFITTLGFFTYKALIFKGYFPMHDDLQVMRIYQMGKCFDDGQIPCRWVPDMGYEYGYPLFNYYPPLPYYIGTVIHKVGIGLFDSVKILFFLQFALSGVLMFFFARRFWGFYGGIVSALFYMYAPYRAVDVYVRGAMAESWAIAFIPGVFWLIDKIVMEKKWRYVWWLGFFYAGVLLSHNLMSLLFIPLSLLWIVLRICQEKAFKQLPKIIVGGCYGIALAAFFTLVVLFETQYVHVETLFIGYFNYLAHFVDLHQLFISDFWGFGGSVWGPGDELSLSLGHLHWIMVFFSFAAFLVMTYHRQWRSAGVVMFFFLTFWLAAFLMHSKATDIWSIVTVLQNLQFPWRFLSVTIFASSFLAGSLLSLGKFTRPILFLILFALLSVSVIVVNAGYFRPKEEFHVEETERFSGEMWKFAITSGIFDYLPKDAKFPPAEGPKRQIEVLSGDVSVTNYAKGSASIRFTSFSNQGATVRLALFNFPYWDVRIGGRPVANQPGGDLGRVTFDIPVGDHQVTVKLQDTQIRRVGNLVSLVAWMAFLGFAVGGIWSKLSLSRGRHSQPDQLTMEVIQKRSAQGMVALTGRRIVLQVINFAVINLILARILSPDVIGVFNIAASIVAFFSFFSDIGLAASLIQKREALTGEDLRTTFTIQQLLVFTVTILLLILARPLADFFQLTGAGVFLIQALSLGFFISSLKIIPAVLLERQLRFLPLVKVEMVETMVFNLLLISLVVKGMGVDSFSWAILARGVCGVVIIYLIAPWKIRLGISSQSAKQLLTFGVPYQMNALLALVKDRLSALFVAKMVGAGGIGYITWAQSIAFLPLEIMNIVIRVTFPAYSRLQEHPDELKKAIEKSLYLTTFLLYPLLFGILGLAPSLVEQIVSDKWRPALPLVYLFAFSTFWAAISTTYTNALTAIGQVKTTLKLMVMWTILTWILTPILVIMFGFVGAAVASCVISFSSVVAIMALHKRIQIDLWGSIGKQLLAAIIMAIMVYALASVLVKDWLSLVAAIFLGMIFYGILMFLFDKQHIKSYTGVITMIFSKNDPNT